MTAKDVEGARKILQPQGRFHAMRMRDGKPDVRAFSNEEYFATLQAGEQKMRERMWNPEVRISGLIASGSSLRLLERGNQHAATKLRSDQDRGRVEDGRRRL